MGTYRKPYKPPLRKESRSRPIFGRGDDADRYFRCWFCGFVCDSQRDDLGGSNSSSGVAHTEGTPLSGEVFHYPGNRSCLGGAVGHFETAAELGADASTAKTVVHNHKSDISRGCPFCGSRNWRGDY